MNINWNVHISDCLFQFTFSLIGFILKLPFRFVSRGWLHLCHRGDFISLIRFFYSCYHFCCTSDSRFSIILSKLLFNFKVVFIYQHLKITGLFIKNCISLTPQPYYRLPIPVGPTIVINNWNTIALNKYLIRPRRA